MDAFVGEDLLGNGLGEGFDQRETLLLYQRAHLIYDLGVVDRVGELIGARGLGKVALHRELELKGLWAHLLKSQRAVHAKDAQAAQLDPVAHLTARRRLEALGVTTSSPALSTASGAGASSGTSELCSAGGPSP